MTPEDTEQPPRETRRERKAEKGREKKEWGQRRNTT